MAQSRCEGDHSVRFSIVIPTQDRAKLLSAAVKHAMGLDHPNFEVIVSDNSTTAARRAMNLDVVREYLDAPHFRIVSPPRVLSLPEHFEFALDHTRGDYVAYLTDKMVVFPQALSDVDEVIRASGADIVNWACAGYYLDDPEAPFGSGTLVEEFAFLYGQPEEYDPAAALRFKARCDLPRGTQVTKDFVLGKIVFGCYSRRLIDQIRARSGTVFGGATHDYSAMIQALSLAGTCVMLNAYEAIFLTLPRAQSLGSATATEPQRALQYFRTFTHPETVLASLLVPDVYASSHNMVAHDYKKFLPMYGRKRFFVKRNWIRAIYSDLLSESLIWQAPSEKDSQLRLFWSHVNRRRLLAELDLRRRAAELRSRLRRSCDRILQRPPPRPPLSAATYEEVPAASLDQAMEHVIRQDHARQIARS
jgi:glycosyltransferase involved in cell wall biosynthesis